MRHMIGVVLLLSAVACVAQIHGVPPSVTSLQPGLGFSNAPRPSVTSLGPFGWGPPFSAFPFNNGFTRHRGPHSGFIDGLPIVVPFYTPYPAYPLLYPGAGLPDNGAAYDPNSQTNGSEDAGPAGNPPASANTDATAVDPPQASATAPADVPAQEPTVLVFRDGHQLQVHNYAIVGNLVYNFSDSGPRRIALSDLDIPATRNINDDRGVFFRLPVTN